MDRRTLVLSGDQSAIDRTAISVSMRVISC
jgi:hypothetical protein